MKKDTLEYRMMLERQRLKNRDSKLLTGSLIGKHPVILDDGKTIIFISDKSKEPETRLKYESRKDNKILTHFAKHHS
jgi:Tol biopolymer transport system component